MTPMGVDGGTLTTTQAALPVRRVRRLFTRRNFGRVVVLAVLVGVAAAARRSAPPAGRTAAQVSATVQTEIDKTLKKQAAQPAPGTTVYQMILPSMVLIQVDRPVRKVTDDSTIGSGVVVNADGSILTSNHLVDGARSITVTFGDGTRSTATVTKSTPEQDVATIKADEQPEVIVAAVLGGGPKVGDQVFAVGHPLGLVGSITAGVVSATGRTVAIGPGKALDGLIQFDAPTNPGSTGGPLLNRAGQVIGIVTDLPNPSEQEFSVGIGFAVPLATAGGGGGGPQL